MKQSKNISVLGCGWLGLALAEKLLLAGHAVKGSTTHKSKLKEIAHKGIESFQIEFNPQVLGNISNFLQSEILIVNIPPRRNTVVEIMYPQIIQNLIQELGESSTMHVLFIGSTSVYPAENLKFTEADSPTPDKASGRALVHAERLLRDKFGKKLTILRFGGLVGYERGPISILRKSKPIRNPDAPLNLIHRDDCIEIILKIINGNFWGYTFNAVADLHPLRREYYMQIAKRFKLSPPRFVEEETQTFKTIGNAYLKETIGYEFIYPNPMEIA